MESSREIALTAEIHLELVKNGTDFNPDQLIADAQKLFAFLSGT